MNMNNLFLYVKNGNLYCISDRAKRILKKRERVAKRNAKKYLTFCKRHGIIITYGGDYNAGTKVQNW